MTIDANIQFGQTLARLSEFIGDLAEQTTDAASYRLLDALALLIGGIDHAAMTKTATTTLVSTEHRADDIHVVAMPFRLE